MAASFFIEGTLAVQNTLISRQGPDIPASSNLFVFSSLPNATTCEPFVITWNYQGDNTPISINITDSGVSQDPPATSTTRHNTDSNTNVARAVPTGLNPVPIVTLPIAQDVLPAYMRYEWQAVTVPQGWYEVVASVSYANEPVAEAYPSLAFFVSNGTDVSCLSSSSTTPSPTSTITTSITSPASSGTSTPTIVPIGGASSSSSHSVGLIVGVTIGCVAFLAIICTTYFWLCRMMFRQRTKPSTGAGAGLSRRWNGLGSTDSRGGFMADPSSRRQHAASIGTIPMSPSEEAVVKAEKHSMHSGRGPFDDGMALATLPVLSQRSRSTSTPGVARSYSMSSSISNGLSAAEYGTAGLNVNTGRRSDDFANSGYPPSSPSSGFGARNSALFIPAPGQGGPGLSRSHSLSTSATHQTSMAGHLGGSSPSTTSHAGLLTQAAAAESNANAYSRTSSPAFPSDAATKQANRRSLGGGKRKPVPAYDAEEQNAAPPVPSLSTTPVPPLSPSPSPLPEHTPHYLTRSQAGNDHSQHELAHKSSFGPGGVEGKPLHYLIPDMPMSLKD
ncbi:hypothetical protein BDN70DRAFT_926961 [Pholiota conissans]|uniref:Uncharacterized protein n=1 Tax=Pholiota conissans TaxID=109636 RepID=A0A9P5ZFT0_9AGAR|nr:hypothetical protein BDN70DRAFT_926961 [Pholiota conissans]